MLRERCEVCDRSLSLRGAHVTGVCIGCRMAGAAFMRRWLADLIAGGLSMVEAADVAWMSDDAVRARLSDARRRGEVVRHG